MNNIIIPKVCIFDSKSKLKEDVYETLRNFYLVGLQPYVIFQDNSAIVQMRFTDTKIYFLMREDFDEWSIGRTYILNGDIYHSGLRMDRGLLKDE